MDIETNSLMYNWQLHNCANVWAKEHPGVGLGNIMRCVWWTDDMAKRAKTIDYVTLWDIQRDSLTGLGQYYRGTERYLKLYISMGNYLMR